MSKKDKPKILVIVGPTASGKSDLAVRFAKKYNGEIISADSRQVYKGLDLGSGKITKQEMRGIPHHLLDVISPQKTFTVADFQKLAYQKIDEILERGKLPIICGGTGFYIQSIVDGIVLPEVPLNKKLREALEKESLEELQIILKNLDSKRFKEIDTGNKVRLIRAIEIACHSGKVPKIKKNPKYKTVQIGIKWPKEKLEERIYNRIISRIRKGMIEEVENLHKNGLRWKRMDELGLEYRYISKYLREQISKEQMIEELFIKIKQYAKRQMTWFKRDKRIVWVDMLEYCDKLDNITWDFITKQKPRKK